MNIEDHVAKYYSKFVFTSPKLTELLTLYFLTIIAISAIKLYYFPLPVLFVSVLVPLVPSNIVSAVLLRNSVLRFKNYLRRVLVMLIFILVNVLFFESLLIIMGFKIPYLVTYGGYSFLHYVIRRSESSSSRSLIESIVPPFIYYAILMVLFNNTPIAIFFTPFIAAILGEVYFLLLRKYSRAGELISAFSKAFLRLWFAEDNRFIEKILEETSVNDRVWIKLFTILDKQHGHVKGVVASTSIHAGPFRNVGSSKVISELRKVLKKVYGNVPIIIFHTTTIHEKDLPSVKHLQNIISHIEGVLERNELETIKTDILYGFKTSCRKQYCVHVIDLDKVPLVILYNSLNGIDDLPPHLNDNIETIVRDAGLKDILVVEAHNAKPERERNMEEECRVFSEIIRKYFIRQENVEKEKSILKIGLAEIENPKLSKCPDLCSNVVNALVFDYNGKLSVTIVYDGNNASKSFKEEVESKVKMLNKNIVFVTIATTDNHEKTGSLGGKTYVPVGASSCRNEILKSTILAVKKALSSLSPSEIVFQRINVQTKVLGSQGLKVLENLAKDLKLIVSLFILLNIFSFFTPFLIAFIY